MDLRSNIQKEFLHTLQESPAWKEFVEALLSVMEFIPDKVEMYSDNLPQVIQILDEYVESAENNIYKLRIDGKGYVKSDTLISSDGLSWSNYIYFEDVIYMQTPLSPLIKVDFYPNRISTKDANILCDLYGVNSDLSQSDFVYFNSATTPYLFQTIIKELGYDVTINYVFQDSEGSQISGSRSFTMRNAIKITNVGLNNLCVYETDALYLSTNDYINGARILSSDKNFLTLDSYVPDGTYDLSRTNYLIPLSSSRLLSVLDMEFYANDEQINNLIYRVTPVRCQEGFRGGVDLRVRINLGLNIIRQHVTLERVPITLQALTSQIENLLIYYLNNAVVHDNKRVYDFYLSQDTFNEITLV